MKQEIAQAIAAAVADEYDLTISPAEVELTYPEAARGDLATNLPFKLSKQLKTPPQAIAERLSIRTFPAFVKSAAAEGGFINFTFKPVVWARPLASIDSGYGFRGKANGEKVQVEFISANPTGPLTLANARGGYFGDVLANVLSSRGYEVVREYYVNDSGNQIDQLSQAVEAVKDGREPEQYKGEYLAQLAGEGAALATEVLDRYIRPAVDKMQIEYDVWAKESEVISEGWAEKAIKALAAQGLLKEEEGALWLISAQLGDDREKRVLRKSNGENSYLLNDIAYHLRLASGGYQRAIKVWGADHAGQVQSLAAAVKKLSPEAFSLDFIIMQMVRLIEGGRELKVSKRDGNFVTVDELIERVGPDVARFFFLMRSPDSHMDFDLDLAQEQSQKNPFHYVMYSYARASSLLKEAANRGLKPGGSLPEPNHKEKELIRKLVQWPELLQAISEDYGVHRLTFYGTELAKLFHDYYESERIVQLPSVSAEQKLYLIQQYQLFLQVYWRILGIKPRSKM